MERKLLAKRLDFVAMSKIPALYLIKNNQHLFGAAGLITFHTPPLKENPIHLIGHKNMDDSLNIINEFNKGLELLKKDGSYNAIKKEFGFTLPKTDIH